MLKTAVAEFVNQMQALGWQGNEGNWESMVSRVWEQTDLSQDTVGNLVCLLALEIMKGKGSLDEDQLVTTLVTLVKHGIIWGTAPKFNQQPSALN